MSMCISMGSYSSSVQLSATVDLRKAPAAEGTVPLHRKLTSSLRRSITSRGNTVDKTETRALGGNGKRVVQASFPWTSQRRPHQKGCKHIVLLGIAH
ncbi:hypothetical protein Y1Q_0000080 [Alligator mississippiensis]|uniref:Uncharacterized protein n=1 Tax=Alligator mississippiensis TaxID=8496 RepID=A0A151NQP6_ALLMI|nr:hypothetical protein Y1Q_0000080 [Alligator mississippiensis]